MFRHLLVPPETEASANEIILEKELPVVDSVKSFLMNKLTP